MMNDELRPYELKQVNDIPWIERIPAHWDVQRGKAVYKKLNRPTRSNDEVVTCFRDGVVTLRKNRRTTGFTESIKEIGYQGIRKGDLVIHVMDAFAGAIGVSDSDGKGTPVYSVCEAKVDLNNYYYAYVIREMAKTGFIQSLYRGIRERSSDFRFEVFANQYLPIPPLSEQDQIVKYLDHQLAKINKFIKTKKKLIAVLKEQKQAIINEVVTKGLDPNVKMKPSGIEWLGDVPEHWERDKANRLFRRIGSGTTPSSGNLKYYNGNIKWINSGDLNDNYLLDTRKTVTEIALADYSVLQVYPKKSIVVAMYGATIGKLSITEFEACCNQACCVLGDLKSNVNLEYAFYALYSCKSSLIEKSRGGGQPNISQEIIKQTWLPIPPMSEQADIVNHIKKTTAFIESCILRVSNEIELITEYRNCLISDAVTGKVDVRNIVIEELEEEIIEDIELDEDSIDEESLEAEDGDE